jgi:hypothetical protein
MCVSDCVCPCAVHSLLVLCDLRSDFSAAAIARARQQLTAALPAPAKPAPAVNPKRKPTTTPPKPQSDLHADVRQVMHALDIYQTAAEHNITNSAPEALRAAAAAVESAKPDDVAVRMKLALHLFAQSQVPPARRASAYLPRSNSLCDLVIVPASPGNRSHCSACEPQRRCCEAAFHASLRIFGSHGPRNGKGRSQALHQSAAGVALLCERSQQL